MGFPVTLSMTAGMFVGWGILSPLSKHLGWAPGPVSSSTDGARGWIVSPKAGRRTDLQLWVALAIMIAESIISLVPITYSSISTAYRHHQQRSSGPKVFTSNSPRNSNLTDDDYYEPTDEDEDPEHEPAERLVPMPWIQLGLGVSAVLCIVLVWLVFGVDGIHPWATAVGLVLASVLSLIGVRALGETDINPVRPTRCRETTLME